MLGATISISTTAFPLSRLEFRAGTIFHTLIIDALLLPREARFV